MKNRIRITTAVSRMFEGEGDAGTATGVGAAGAGTTAGTTTTTGAGTTTATPPPNPNPNNVDPNRKYTQQEFDALLNRRLAEDRRKGEEKNRQIAAELSSLRESANLTEAQRRDLENRIEQLNAEYRTAEEQKRLDQQKAQEKYDRDTKKLSEERDSWRTRHDANLINGDIVTAAAKHEAFNVNQIVAILRPMTKVVERMDSAGKPTGEFISQVKFHGKDRDGKPVVLDLTVDDAVKAMKDMPEDFGNLFKSTSVNGLGMTSGNGASSNGRLPDIDNMSLQEYQRRRAEIHGAIRKAR